MVVAINGRFLAQRLTGVQRFATEIVRALGAVAPGEVVLYAPPDSHDPSIPGVAFRQVGRMSGPEWEQLELPAALRRGSRPPLVSLCNMGPVFYSPHYYTLHDVTFRRYPGGFSRAFLTLYGLLVPTLLRRAQHVFTVSQFSLDEISKEFGICRSKVSVMYNAATTGLGKEPLYDSEFARDPYFFTIGSAGSNKNLITLFRAYDEYRASGGAARLAVLGARSSRTPDSPDGVDFLDRISDAELARRYANAIAYVSTSLYEGFSIPLLEAQSVGCPVVASRIPVHEEVLGDSALFFRPQASSELASLLHAVERGPSAGLVASGWANVNRFNWEDSARTLLNCVREST
jgi:glycosyltransferase involved in cell wall biosynthesis